MHQSPHGARLAQLVFTGPEKTNWLGCGGSEPVEHMASEIAWSLPTQSSHDKAQPAAQKLRQNSALSSVFKSAPPVV